MIFFLNKSVGVQQVSDIIQNLLPLSNQIPNWTLDKIGILKIQVPIGTYRKHTHIG